MLFILLITNISVAWDDCPFGLVNDSSPGECSRYVDSNNDTICDRSQLEPNSLEVDFNSAIATDFDSQKTAQPIQTDIVTATANLSTNEIELSGAELKTMTVVEVAKFYSINTTGFINALSDKYSIKVSPSDDFQLLHDNYGFEPNTIKDIAITLKNGESSVSVESKKTIKYDFIWLVTLIFISYLTTYYLAHINKITVFLHRRIWNIILLIFTIGVLFTGIYLWLKIAYGLILPLPINILTLHVAIGIVFTIIAVFHIAWHFPYYNSYVIKQKSAKKN